MTNQHIKKLVLAAMFAALTCAATMVVRVPSPTNGYVNLGDCLVLLAAWLLGPLYGALAAGIGSALADLLSSYPHYVPGTFVIKGLMALTAALLSRGMTRAHLHAAAAAAISGLAAEAEMVAGYFLYSCLILGRGLAAAASVPGNLFQGAFGLIAAVILVVILKQNRTLARLTAADAAGNGRGH